MKGLRVRAKTAAGEKALRTHIADTHKMPWHSRALLKQLYEQKVTGEDPFTLSITHKSARVAALVGFEQMLIPIRDAMLHNGAVLNIDYEVKEL